MKKAVVLLIAIIMVFSLCSCKSKEASSADKLIKQIGEVSLKSEKSIVAAEKAVKELSDEQAKELDRLDELTDARKEYDTLVLKDKASKANDLIKKIGTVTKDSGEKIKDARKAFDSLPEDAKQYVADKKVLVEAELKIEAVLVDEKISSIGEVTLSSASSLTESRQAYNSLSDDEKKYIKKLTVLEEAEKVYDTLSSDEVIALIDEIGVVTIASKDKIVTARSKYDALSTAGKKLVINYEILVEKESTLETVKEQEKQRVLNAALSRVRTKTDRVNEVTWYQSTSEPYYANSRSYVLPYIGKFDSGLNVLHLVYHYTGDDWLFYDEIIFLIDGERHTESFSYGEVERDNGGGDVWERADTVIFDRDLIVKIAESNETIVRFQGDSDHFDFTVRASDKQAIKDIFTLYDIFEDEYEI